MKLAVSAAGGAAPDEVWDRYIHPARWPEWSPQISSVEASDATLRSGTTGTVHGPCGIAVTFAVLGVDDENRTWSWEVRAVGISLTLLHTVMASESAGPGGSATTLDIRGPAPVVVGYAPIARIALGRLVR